MLEKWNRINNVERKKDTTPVPQMEYYQNHVACGNGDRRTYTKVLMVQTKVEDADYVKELISITEKEGKLPAKFIPAGFVKARSAKQYLATLNNKNRFLNYYKMIPIIGLSEKLAKKKVKSGEKVTTVLEYVRKQLHAYSIERTSQTTNLGKWMIITSTYEFESLKIIVNKDFPRIFKAIIEDEPKKVPCFDYPRHPGSQTIDTSMESYLNVLDAEYEQEEEAEFVALNKPN